MGTRASLLIIKKAEEMTITSVVQGYRVKNDKN